MNDSHDLELLLGLALVAALAVPGCAENIRPEAELDAAVPTGPVLTVDNGDGTFTTRVDATAAESWRYVDLTAGTEGAEGGTWTIAAQRFHIKLDGGISGDGGVEAAPVPGSLAAVTAAPAAGWITDVPDGDDPDPEPDYAFEQGDGWYAYDVSTHVLTPRPLVWVVRRGAGDVVKLAIEAYYDDAGNSGVFTMRWARLSPGSGARDPIRLPRASGTAASRGASLIGDPSGPAPRLAARRGSLGVLGSNPQVMPGER